MQENALRVALIGCGVVGEKRLHAIKETGLGELVTAFDVSRERAQALKVRVARDAREILENPNIDIVVISTPNIALSEYGVLALQNNKHVLIEKPGAVSPQGIREMSRLANTKQLRCKIGYNHRFLRSAQKITAELNSGKWSDILWVRATYGHGGRPGYEREWRFNRELSGGGEIIDQGVHLLDLVQWWMKGPLTLAFSARQNAFYRSTEEDNGFLVLRSEKGAIAQLHCSATQWKNLFRIEIATHHGLLAWEGIENSSYGKEQLTLYRRNPEGGIPEKESCDITTDTSSWNEEWRHFYGCVLDDEKELLSSIEESEWIFRILDQIHGDGVTQCR